MLTPIVTRALTQTITDIGQVTDAEKRELNRAVKAGYLSKGKGGGFPILKTVYAHPGFDFAADRREQVGIMLRAHAIDQALGVARFFPKPEYREIRAGKL